MDFHPPMDIVKNVRAGHGDVLVLTWCRNLVGIILAGQNRILLIDSRRADYLCQQITLEIVVVRAVG